MTEPSNQRVLLVVEDDEGLQRQLKWAYEGYRVVAAADRLQAIEMLRLHEPAVVTLDLGLPPDPDGTSEGFATLNEILTLKPDAKVIVTGYPLLFHLDSSGVNSKYQWADEVNAETVVLNDVIESVATSNGAVFVDVEDDFAGHGVGSTAPWINDWSWLSTTNGFHPTASGYVAYAAAIRAAIPAG